MWWSGRFVGILNVNVGFTTTSDHSGQTADICGIRKILVKQPAVIGFALGRTKLHAKLTLQERMETPKL